MRPRPEVNGHAEATLAELCRRLRLSGDGHGKIGQIHAQAAFGVDRCFRPDVGGGYSNPQLLRLPRAARATATPNTNFTAL
jgi:hypothetical protein